jgi:hypothetical protein
VGRLEPELIQQPRDGEGEGGGRRLDTLGQRGRLAEPGEIDGDDVGHRCKRGHDGVPCLPEGSEAVQQHERLPTAGPGERQSGHANLTAQPPPM